MKVVYTEDALRDLDAALDFIKTNYPGITSAFIRRLKTIEQRIGRWPESAEEVEQRPGMRMELSSPKRTARATIVASQPMRAVTLRRSVA